MRAFPKVRVSGIENQATIEQVVLVWLVDGPAKRARQIGNLIRTMKTIALFFLLCHLASGLVIRDFSTTRHNRFLNFPAAPTPNPAFLHAATDLTGVGWYISPSNTAVELRRQFTMVSPKHFVGAYHFRPSVLGSIRFVAPNGMVRTYEVESLQTILNDEGKPTDLFIGTLENEIAPTDGISFHPYLSLAGGNYVGQELIFMGHRNDSGSVTHRGGRGVLQARVQFGAGTEIGDETGFNKTEGFFWVYRENEFFDLGDPDDAHVQSGDSGSPSLVPVDGRGAIVGIHSLLGTVEIGFSTEYTNYDTFVPFYIDELNSRMEAEGYHMTRAVPGAIKPTTTLTVNETLPAIMRAGYPVSIPIDLSNTGVVEDANNIRFSQTLPNSSGVSLDGALWVASTSENLAGARKGGIPKRGSSSLNLTFTPETPGSFTSVVKYSADEFSEAMEEIEFQIVESYLSWSADLGDPAQISDLDGDGLPNLHEYAFGGDPEVASVVHPVSGVRLIPTVSAGPSGVVVSYVQRIDAAERALTYEVEGSSTLAPGSWTPVPGTAQAGSPSPVHDGFEQVSIEIPDTPESRFFRLKVTLSE